MSSSAKQRFTTFACLLIACILLPRLLSAQPIRGRGTSDIYGDCDVAILELNVTQLPRAGEWLGVNWTLACETPTNDAFLAILPELSDDDLRSTSPVKLLPTYGAPSGTVSFWMPNLRVPYVVGLYRGGLDSPSTSPPLATSPPVTWAQPNEPTGVHISLFGPGALTISWTTHNETAPVVFWRRQTPGQDPVQELFNASASIAVLTRASFFGDADVNWRPSRPMELSSNATKLGWLPPGTQHSAVLTNLSPGAYDYAVGTAADAAGRRLDRGFVMPPTSGPFSFLVVADMGVEEIDGSNWDFSGVVASHTELSMRGWDNKPSRNTSARLQEELASGAGLILLNGDLSYARGFAAVWESFMALHEPWASRVPLMTLPGNHESNWPRVGSAWNTSSLDSGGEGGVAYSHRFPMPPPATWAAPWYSFDVAGVHFVALSTEHDMSASSPQVVWLEADLSANEGARWKVVSAHRFFYADTSGGEGDCAAGQALRSAVEPLFLRHGVDLVLAGHHHSAQLTCPVAFGECVALNDDGSAAAPVYVLTGNAGAGLSGFSGSPDPIYRSLVGEYGYARVAVNDTHLTVSSRRSADGSEVFSASLFKPPQL